jgi:hypothetical protein
VGEGGGRDLVCEPGIIGGEEPDIGQFDHPNPAGTIGISDIRIPILYTASNSPAETVRVPIPISRNRYSIPRYRIAFIARRFRAEIHHLEARVRFNSRRNSTVVPTTSSGLPDPHRDSFPSQNQTNQ